SIARAWARDGVLAFIVAPGWVKTDMASVIYEGGHAGYESALAEIPMGDAAPPEQVANMIVFLLSGLVDHATGGTFDINGASYVRGARSERQRIRHRAIERGGRRDQREVGERLREVAEVAGIEPELLGVEPDVVRVARHLLEQQPCLVHLSGAREALAVPERAHREAAFVGTVQSLEIDGGSVVAV